MNFNIAYLTVLVILTSASGQIQGPLLVYELCRDSEDTFCMGVIGSVVSLSPLNEGCLLDSNCSHILHVTREAGRNRVTWRYHVQSEPNSIGGEFDLAVTHDLMRLSYFKSQVSKRVIPEMPASLPFMRGWVDESGDLQNDPFYKRNDNDKPQPIRKNRIFTPVATEENRVDEETGQMFNIYSFTSRMDDLVYRDPNTGNEVYHLNLNDPVHFTLLAYRVQFKKRGERGKTFLSTILRNIPVFQLWDDRAAKTMETTTLIPTNMTTRRIKMITRPKRIFFGHEQVRAFRSLPVWQKLILGTMWAICIVMLTIIVISLCECGIRRKQSKRRSVSFRREETPMSQITTQSNGLGNQKLLSM